jgi:hypothetical protein
VSAELLSLLADRYTFDSTPPFVDLGAYHVPYRDGASLRRVIQLCHVALNEAVERPGASTVTGADLVAAINAG